MGALYGLRGRLPQILAPMADDAGVYIGNYTSLNFRDEIGIMRARRPVYKALAQSDVQTFEVEREVSSTLGGQKPPRDHPRQDGGAHVR
jgi:hypothetical protein